MSNWPLKLHNFAKTCGRTLTHDEESSGPQHAEAHTVTYYLNGIEFGKARASTLTDARMTAAKQAYEALDTEING